MPFRFSSPLPFIPGAPMPQYGGLHRGLAGERDQQRIALLKQAQEETMRQAKAQEAYDADKLKREMGEKMGRLSLDQKKHLLDMLKEARARAKFQGEAYEKRTELEKDRQNRRMQEYGEATRLPPMPPMPGGPVPVRPQVPQQAPQQPTPQLTSDTERVLDQALGPIPMHSPQLQGTYKRPEVKEKAQGVLDEAMSQLEPDMGPNTGPSQERPPELSVPAAESGRARDIAELEQVFRARAKGARTGKERKVFEGIASAAEPYYNASEGRKAEALDRMMAAAQESLSVKGGGGGGGKGGGKGDRLEYQAGVSNAERAWRGTKADEYVSAYSMADDAIAKLERAPDNPAVFASVIYGMAKSNDPGAKLTDKDISFSMGVTSILGMAEEQIRKLFQGQPGQVRMAAVKKALEISRRSSLELVEKARAEMEVQAGVQNSDDMEKGYRAVLGSRFGRMEKDLGAKKAADDEERRVAEEAGATF